MKGRSHARKGVGLWIIIGMAIFAIWLMRYSYKLPDASDDDCDLVYMRPLHGQVMSTRMNHMTGDFVAEILTAKGPVKIQKWYVDSPSAHIEKGDSIAKDSNTMVISVYKANRPYYFDLKGFSDCSSVPHR